MWRLAVAQRSERGGRERNEDAVGFCSNETLGCFVLADGAGGHKGGEIASDTVVKQVLADFSAAPLVNHESIHALMSTARHALFDARELHPQCGDMNTTIVTLTLDTAQSLAYWHHLGDSRIYLFRDGRARRLTIDHSVLQSMIDAGLATDDELRGNCKRNMLYAAVGSEEVPDHAICAAPLPLCQGDTFLLCTDGLWERVDEDTMEALLQQAHTPEQWIDDMMRKLPNPDGPEQDNYSALAIWVGEREAAAGQ